MTIIKRDGDNQIIGLGYAIAWPPKMNVLSKIEERKHQMATAFADEMATKNISKVQRYKWTTKDEPGQFRTIPKHLLQVDLSYQRDEHNQAKILTFASSWSWVACGVIIVGHRNGAYWVIDGQNRVLAARRREDIRELPCMIFETEGAVEEAKGFLNINDGRKPVQAIAKHKARITAQDQVALLIQHSFDTLGLRLVRSAKVVGDITCVEWARRRVTENQDAYFTVLKLAVDVHAQDDMPMLEKVLDGLWYLHRNVKGGFDDARLKRRVLDVGARRLLDGANRASVFYRRGGAKVFGTGMLEEINKNLRSKFSFGGDEAKAA